MRRLVRGLPRRRRCLPSFAARADDYPTHEIHVICAFPAGSGADVLVRYFAEKLRVLAGKPVIVENKTGANGNIAAEYTARAKPDGYTIHIHAGSSTAANFSLFRRPPINPAKDLQVVATLNQQPFMVVVAAASPYKTLARADRGHEAEGREGELRGVQHHRQGDGRALQDRDRRAGARRALSHGERFHQRLRERRRRLRHDGSGQRHQPDQCRAAGACWR